MKPGLPGQVEEHRRIAERMGAEHSVATIMLISAEAGYLLVAGGAGMKTIDRQTPIIEEFPAEFDAFLTQRIVGKFISRLGKSLGYLLRNIRELVRILRLSAGTQAIGQENTR